MYSRFFTKALRDLGYFNLNEPFKGLFTQGMVTHQTFKNSKGDWVEPGEVENVNGTFLDKNKSFVSVGKVEKMSKSKKNVVDPNDIINLYGADTARWFMLSDSPPERDLQWTETGIASSYKFINKLWEFIDKYKKYESKEKTNPNLLDKFKVLINNISEDIENFHFNKSVAKIYEYVNLLNDVVSKKNISEDDFSWSLKKLSLILQPFLPHISEEIWENLSTKSLCIDESWPVENIVGNNTKINIAIQINGKTRNVIEVEKDLDKKDIMKIIKADNKIKKYIEKKKINKEIYVPGKIVNIVL